MNDEHIKLKLAKHGYDADKIRSYHDLYLLANDAYIDPNSHFLPHQSNEIKTLYREPPAQNSGGRRRGKFYVGEALL